MRQDAVRNRRAVLDAAGRLFDAADDPDQVSMDAIAAAARVGKGTLFRRFGSRDGLILALFEERSRQLHEDWTARHDHGGAPAAQALDLLLALLQFKTENRVVALAMDASDGNPYRSGDYLRWHVLLTGLVRQARGPEGAGFVAHALLAATRTDLVGHLGGWPDPGLQNDLAVLVEAVLGPAANP